LWERKGRGIFWKKQAVLGFGLSFVVYRFLANTITKLQPFLIVDGFLVWKNELKNDKQQTING